MEDTVQRRLQPAQTKINLFVFIDQVATKATAAQNIGELYEIFVRQRTLVKYQSKSKSLYLPQPFHMLITDLITKIMNPFPLQRQILFIEQGHELHHFSKLSGINFVNPKQCHLFQYEKCVQNIKNLERHILAKIPESLVNFE